MSEPRLVVIEDNPADVLLLRDALAQAGLECSLEQYTNGEQALLAVNSMEKAPDLILLDLNLPRVHGFEILKAIRDRPQLAAAKVAVLTTSRAPADQLQSQKLGANAYIVKPSGYEDFLASVSKAINDLLGRAQGAGQSGARQHKTVRHPAAHRALGFGSQNPSAHRVRRTR
jgi:CheY-like chemotaxis protein